MTNKILTILAIIVFVAVVLLINYGVAMCIAYALLLIFPSIPLSLAKLSLAIFIFQTLIGTKACVK